MFPMTSTVAFRVDELLEERGWTVVRLASVADLDPKTVRNIVNNKATRVDLETIAKLSDALRVTPGELMIKRPTAVERQAAWLRLRGIAGQGTPEDFADWPGGHSVETNPSLERATRP